MGFLKSLGSVWLMRRFPALAIAGMAYGMYKRHRATHPNTR